MTRIEEVFAEREFEAPGPPARRVVARVGKPFQKATGEWWCPVQVEGLPKLGDKVSHACGGDSLQALQLGLVLLRTFLAYPGETLLLYGEEAKNGGVYDTILRDPAEAADQEDA